MVRATTPSVCLLCFIVSGGVSSFGQTDFESLDKQARDKNPSGVDVTLRTTSGRSIFHLFEAIPIELVFQSSNPRTYSIELDEVMNFAGQANRFAVFPTDSVQLTMQAMSLSGTSTAVCCGTDRRYLSLQPTILKRELTDYMRFEKPGTYSIYYATRRVFRGRIDTLAIEMSSLTLTSKILTLTILPDNPEWDSVQLSKILKILGDPGVKAEYARALAHLTTLAEAARDFYQYNRLSQTELAKAQKALNMIDTEEAIRKRVELMQMNTKDELESMRRFHLEAVEAEPLLKSTTRPDIFVRCMRERIEAADFGVDYNFYWWWTQFLSQAETPGCCRPPTSVSFSPPAPIIPPIMPPDYHPVPQDHVARRDTVSPTAVIQAALVNKKGEAANVTALTLKLIDAPPGPHGSISQ